MRILSAHLTQLTQSRWALSTACISLRQRGSNINMLFFSHAATRRDLKKEKNWQFVLPLCTQVKTLLLIANIIIKRQRTYPSGENSKLKTPPCTACLKLSPWSHDVHGRIEEYSRFENLSAYPKGNRWPISLCLNQELLMILVLTFGIVCDLDFRNVSQGALWILINNYRNGAISRRRNIRL